ncbi:MAG: hypothetical protein ACM3X6_04630 [Patescibacteria group bacterium]
MRFFFILFALLAAGLPGRAAEIARVPESRVLAVLSSLPGPEGARSWLAGRRDEVVRLMSTPHRRTARLREGLRLMAEAGVHAAAVGGATDPARGFVIYSPETTLRLFLLDRARNLYEAALDTARPESLPSLDELYSIGGQALTTTEEEKYPDARRAAAVLRALPVPDAALRGYKVFLLPFAMGDVSGQGGPGYTFLAAEPRHERLIENQLEVTLTHEFGHYVHLAGMPRETAKGRRLWDEYLELRGLIWREDGPVKTQDWARSSEETFAEDFRLLFGGLAAAGEPSAARAGDPRSSRETARGLRYLMSAAAARAKPRRAYRPWPEPVQARYDAGMLLLRTPVPVLALLLAAVPISRGRRGKAQGGQKHHPLSPLQG